MKKTPLGCFKPPHSPAMLRPAGDLMTINLNLAGLPAVTVPCGFAEEEDGARLPVGLQFVGRAFGEAQLLQLAHVFEQTAEFARGVPQVYAT